MTDNAIKEILFDYEIDIWRDKRRFMSLLSDYMPSEADKAYRNLIGISVDESIPEEIKYDDKNSIYRCKQRLCNASGCSEEKGLDVVNMWAEAFKTEEEFRNEFYGKPDSLSELYYDIEELALDVKLYKELKDQHIDYIRELCTYTKDNLISLIGEEKTSSIRSRLKNRGFHLYNGKVDCFSKYRLHIRLLANTQPPGWELKMLIEILIFNMYQLEEYSSNASDSYIYDVWFGKREKEYSKTNNKMVIKRLLEDYDNLFEQINAAFSHKSIKTVLDTHNPELIVSLAERIINAYKATIALKQGFEFYIDYRKYIDYYNYRYIETGVIPANTDFKEYNEWFSILADDGIGEFYSFCERLVSLQEEFYEVIGTDSETILRKMVNEFEMFCFHVKEFCKNATEGITEWIDADSYSKDEKKRYGLRQCIRILNKEVQYQTNIVIHTEEEYEQFKIIWEYIKDLPLPSGKEPCDLEISERLSGVLKNLEYFKDCSENERHTLSKLERELKELRTKLDELK